MAGNGFISGATAASDPSCQVQLQTRGRGRKAEGHSSAYSTPWGMFLRGHSPPSEKASSRQFALLEQEGEKVPERKGTGIAPVVSHKPGGGALSLRPKVLGRIVTELTRGRGDAPYHPAMLWQKSH